MVEAPGIVALILLALSIPALNDIHKGAENDSNNEWLIVRTFWG